MEPVFGAVQASEVRLNWLGEQIKQHFKGKHFIEMLEVGSYEGQSALYFGTLLEKEFGLARITCIDPWMPYLSQEAKDSEHCARMDAELESGTVRRRFLENMKLLPNKCAFQSYQGTFPEYVRRQHSIKQFDLIYIDGSHRYNDVLTDLVLAKVFLAPGGMIMGDDLEVQAMEITIEQAKLVWQHSNDDYWNGFHPGVTGAVANVFGPVQAHMGAWVWRK